MRNPLELELMIIFIKPWIKVNRVSKISSFEDAKLQICGLL